MYNTVYNYNVVFIRFSKGFYGYPGTFHLCGDIHNLACNRAKDNMAAITNKMGVASSSLVGVPMDIIKWDICNLPLKTSSVDIIVTDMVSKGLIII